MSEPLVCILICTIRTDPRLELTLESLKNQTYPNFELVYVDAIKDKRTPEFLELIERYSKFFKIKHVQDKPWEGMGNRPGIANARNSGILYCAGDIICVTGDNTWLSIDWIQRHVNLVNNGFISVSPCCNIKESMKYHHFRGTLLKHKNHPTEIHISLPNVLLTGSGTEEFDAPTDCRLPGLEDDIFFGKDKFIQAPCGYLHGVSFAISLDRYLNTNGMDESFDQKGYGFEDCDFGARLNRMGFRIALDPANWVVSINDKINKPLNEMFGSSGEINQKKWEASAQGETPIWVNDYYNLRKLRERLKYYDK
jgi:glycosyltransferase involved in cell wall biosynthesis